MQKEIIKLSDYTTFRMGGAAELYTLHNKKDIEDFFKVYAEYVFVGGGSNVLIAEELTRPFVTIKASSTIVETCDSAHVYVRAQAGKNWDEFVSETVHARLSGLELLSYIPGTVGAAPVQNVGAYGAEVKDTLIQVTIFDAKKKEWKILSASECHFAYRKSIFQEHKEYIIVDTLWKLSKTQSGAPTYPSLKAYMDERAIPLTLSSLRDAVIAVRKSKLPEIDDAPSVGSFFKNPIVTKEQGEKLKSAFETLPLYDVPEGYKLAAGYLIEKACSDLGVDRGLSLYEKNKLVVVNKGRLATLADVDEYTKMIQEKVKELFGVDLVREPETIR
jgi:UDP-N-acetylmuramate dehydrogenase